MLYRVGIIVTLLVALCGIGYVFLTALKRRRQKRGNTSAKDAASGKHDRKKPKNSPVEVPATSAVAESFPPVEVREAPIPGSELRYYQAFGPSDTIFDAWFKLQAFTSTEPIAVRLIPTDGTTPILVSSFLPDGTVHSSTEVFFLELANAIRSNGGPGAWRGVRQLSSFGIPASAREGAYHIFTGSLRLELKGVRIMGLTFSIAVTFEPNLGLIPKHFSDLNTYFHCEMPVGGIAGKGRSEPDNVVIGFPWSLSGVTLHSQDSQLESEGGKIIRAIIGKYEKFVCQNQVVVPTPEDANRKVTLVSDGIVGIAIHQGIAHGRRFLRIEYGPTPQGPIDEISAGDAEFLRFAKAVEITDQPLTGIEQEPTFNTPF